VLKYWRPLESLLRERQPDAAVRRALAALSTGAA